MQGAIYFAQCVFFINYMEYIMPEREILISKILDNLYQDLCMDQMIHDGWTTHVLRNGHRGLNDYSLGELTAKCKELEIEV